MAAGVGYPSVAEIKGFKLPRTTKKKKTVDLAIDISSSCVGWAVGIKPTPEKWGKFVFRSNADVGEKLVAFDEFFRELLIALKPDRLFVEKPQTRKGKTTERHLEILGVMRLLWRETANAEILDSWIIPARTVKNFLQVPRGRNHAANKQIMVKKINELYGLKLKFHKNSKYQSDDDTADALAVLTTGWR